MRFAKYLGIAVIVTLLAPPAAWLAVGLARDRDLASSARAIMGTSGRYELRPADLQLGTSRSAVEVGQIVHPDIIEASGLAPSRRVGDLLWVLNDGGSDPILYALDLAGRYRAQTTIVGAQNVDWEDLSSFEWNGKAYLMAADVGDNLSWRKTVMLYVIEEPELASDSHPDFQSPIAWQTEFRYEDGPRDCEAVATDPTSGQVLLLEKQLYSAGLYSLPLGPSQDSTAVARRIATVTTLPGPSAEDLNESPILGRYRALATALDVSLDGSKAIVLTYRNALLFERRNGEEWASSFRRRPLLMLKLPPIFQAEAMSFGSDSSALYITSEWNPAPLLRLELD